jgi:hypothetical protein
MVIKTGMVLSGFIRVKKEVKHKRPKEKASFIIQYFLIVKAIEHNGKKRPKAKGKRKKEVKARISVLSVLQSFNSSIHQSFEIRPPKCAFLLSYSIFLIGYWILDIQYFFRF